MHFVAFCIAAVVLFPSFSALGAELYENPEWIVETYEKEVKEFEADTRHFFAFGASAVKLRREGRFTSEHLGRLHVATYQALDALQRYKRFLKALILLDHITELRGSSLPSESDLAFRLARQVPSSEANPDWWLANIVMSHSNLTREETVYLRDVLTRDSSAVPREMDSTIRQKFLPLFLADPGRFREMFGFDLFEGDLIAQLAGDYLSATALHRREKAEEAFLKILPRALKMGSIHDSRVTQAVRLAAAVSFEEACPIALERANQLLAKPKTD